MLRPIFAFALIVTAAALLNGSSDEATATSPCSVAVAAPALELEYALQAGERTVTAHTRDVAVTVICERLHALGIPGAEVLPHGTDHVRVVLPGVTDSSEAQQALAQIGAPGQLRFYDWEPNLIGREKAIGGHPGRRPDARALRQAKREWRAAGRLIGKRPDARLMLAGAFPNLYGAVRLASRQKIRECGARCSASGPRFYMFDRSPAHKLIAGPTTQKAGLHGGIVLEVPTGTTIASEQPNNGRGEVLRAADPGWYAIVDRAALTGADIVRPEQITDEFGAPSITFGFTARGRVAFHRVTRAIARRGRSEAPSQVTAAGAERLSGHFALVFDHEIKTRPIINFLYNPKGIDGRTGAQISGGFNNAQEAHELAEILRTGSLPVDLKLVRQGSLAS